MNNPHDYNKVFSAYAPGRLDVMGGIADYSGSLLLQMPISEKTNVEMQKRDDGIFHIQSYLPDGEKKEVLVNFSDLEGKPPEEVGVVLRSKKGNGWSAYVIGCFAMLDWPVTGADVVIHSTVPLGKGVSSSASLEVATMRAICKMCNIKMTGAELPILAQKVENIVVGAACGLMDQLAVYLGRENKLLPIQCQPANVYDPINIPAGIEFCGIDSGVRHAVGGSSYGDVRTAAFMGYSIISSIEGIDDCELQKAKIDENFQQLPYSGYLSNIPVEVFEKKYVAELPETMKGKDFLAWFKVSIDNYTVIDPAKDYKVRACTAHPVYEMDRVERFQEFLQLLNDYPFNENILHEMGKLMFASHESYTAVGLGSAETDLILNAVIKEGAERGLYGARISGGGSGGTVVILCKSGMGVEKAKRIHQRLEQHSGMKLYFFENKLI
ncbi:MAG TPA: hypothetical protein VJT83_04815 [Chitinophagaceae bacterium]|nr:hypothetical protein [Chitinophagaceae bacterium]